MLRHLKRLICPAILFLTSTAAFAQNEPVIRATLQTMGLGASYSDLFIKQGEKYTQLVIQADKQTVKGIDYTGPANLPVLRRTKTNQGFAYVPAAEVRLPDAAPGQVNEFILFVTPGPGGQPKVAAIRNDHNAFPDDSVRIINATRFPAGVKAQSAVSVIPPSSVKVMALGKDSSYTDVHVAIPVEERWIEVGNNAFALSKDYRRTVFIVEVAAQESAQSKRPRLTLMSMAELKDKSSYQNIEVN